MHRAKAAKKEGTRLMGMPVNEALELILFIIFLAAVLGAIFREKFVYVVFALIVLLMLYEGHQRRKEKKLIEKKFDEVLLKKRREAGL